MILLCQFSSIHSHLEELLFGWKYIAICRIIRELSKILSIFKSNKTNLPMNSYKDIDRAQFMEFFRDDEKLVELTVDDRVEIFFAIFYQEVPTSQKNYLTKYFQTTAFQI